ncbi:hypothetical protein RV18_GL000317 [Enterococcus termitis]|nr:hypothetical protein RV18_GL000317 [Enterococcus termitis]
MIAFTLFERVFERFNQLLPLFALDDSLMYYVCPVSLPSVFYHLLWLRQPQ